MKYFEGTFNANELGFKSTADSENRILPHSKEYDSTDLVRVLYTAIICGLLCNPHAVKTEIYRPGPTYQGHALKLVESDVTNYTWGHLTSQLGMQIRDITTNAGSTSKVFLALDNDGRECVIKMYVKKDDDSGKFLKTEKFNQLAKASTDAEVDALVTTYPFLKGEVSAKRLSGQYCVIMPFFRPLKKTERSKFRAMLKGALKRLYGTGKTYKEDDLRWRHVGMYTEEQIVLFDLAELAQLKKPKPDEEEFVKGCLEKLCNRSKFEPPVESILEEKL